MVNGTLTNSIIAVPCKIAKLTNCKIKLKLKWTKYCVLSAFDNDHTNDNDNANKIIFTTKPQSYMFLL